MKIAVIGSGIAGLASAWLLARQHDVVLYEKDGRPGGHTHTVVTPSGQAVDTGFIVYNERNYPNFTALLRTLGVATGASAMSFGVSIGNGALEYAGDSDVLRMFAQRRNWLSWRHHRMWLEILRFNRATLRALRAGSLPDITLHEYLDRGGYGAEFRTRYLLPMAGAIWSCSTRAALAFPLPVFARFFDAHGLLEVLDGPPWRHVEGGSRSYVQRLLAEFRGRRRIGDAAALIRRDAGGVRVATAGDEARFDAVICATHTDQALRLLADADAAEHAVLGATRFVANEAVLHTDASLMPRRRRAWCAWNYLADADGVSDRRVTVSYWMNRLQQIPGPTQYFVTLNPLRPPDPARVLFRAVYEHPVFTREAVAAQARLPAIQGRRGVWFCGAWTGYGFHEDGLNSAIAAATALGCPPHWAPLVAAPATGTAAPALVPEVEPT
jgi:predicted NAD/FAD-binding protein